MDFATYKTASLMEGAYDLHIHPAPSPFNRGLDDQQLLQAAGAAKMAGILLKSHYEPTAARAQLANQHTSSSTVAYGAIVLNWPVGGLNPYAVHNTLKRGAKIVFMPTRDAANSLVSGDMPGDFFQRPGIRILTEEGKLKSEVYDILSILSEHKGTLATGHISPEESILLCKEGIRKGVRMVLTHPEFSRTKIPPDVQKELADSGVWIEKCWYNIGEKECTAKAMAWHIRQVGAEHCYMTTDRGQADRELPVDAMENFMAAMLNQGITEQEIRTMTHDIPRLVLGI